MWPIPQETADLVTFTEKILNRGHNFLYSESDTRSSRLLQKLQNKK